METTKNQTQRFKAAKGKAFILINCLYLIMGFGIIATGYWLQESISAFDWMLSLLWFAFIILHFHRWQNTYYEIQGDTLFYRSGFTKGSIPIKSIRKISKEKKGVGDLKAALSGNGLLLTYNKYDDVYLAPENQELFIAGLKKLNPAIEITQPKKESRIT